VQHFGIGLKLTPPAGKLTTGMSEAAPREKSNKNKSEKTSKKFKKYKKSSNAIPAVAPSNIAVKGYPRARKEVLPQLQLFSTPIKLRRTFIFFTSFCFIKCLRGENFSEKNFH